MRLSKSKAEYLGRFSRLVVVVVVVSSCWGDFLEGVVAVEAGAAGGASVAAAGRFRFALVGDILDEREERALLS